MKERTIGKSTGYGSGPLPTPDGWSPGGQDFEVQSLNRSQADYDREAKVRNLPARDDDD